MKPSASHFDIKLTAQQGMVANPNSLLPNVLIFFNSNDLK
jgi:hypothetical protein